MKKVLFTLTVLFSALFAMNSFAQDAVKVESGAQIKFEKEVHNYGTIEQNANGVCEFVFTNTGDSPLIISAAKGSCGCTVPSYPETPINPGETGIISVKYDTKRVGPFGKSVTLTSNAVNTPTKVIRIKGTVKAKPQAGSPVNKTGAPAN